MEDPDQSLVCPKCQRRFDSKEYANIGFRRFAKYIHKIGSHESVFSQTCFVRLKDDDSKNAVILSKEKEDFLDPEALK